LARSRIPGDVNASDSQRRDWLSINLNRLESPFLQRIQRMLFYIRDMPIKSLRALNLAFWIYHYLIHYLASAAPLPRQFWRFTMYPPFLQLIGA